MLFNAGNAVEKEAIEAECNGRSIGPNENEKLLLNRAGCLRRRVARGSRRSMRRRNERGKTKN